MTAAGPFDAYLQLAEAFFRGDLSEIELAHHTRQLPVLDQQGVEHIASLSEAAGVAHPRQGYAIAAVACEAAQAAGPFTRALAACHKARAANQWSRPNLAWDILPEARRIFSELGELGWVAACDWQMHAIPWLSSDLQATRETLVAALAGLAEAGFSEFEPHCRLALAYAQMLTGNQAEALENVRASEAVFAARGDRLNQARCWQQQASILRRLRKYKQAIPPLQQANEVFNQLGARFDFAKTRHIQAYVVLFSTSIYQDVVPLFMEAVRIFQEEDIPLWEAQSLHGLAQVHTETGNLREARAALRTAREAYAGYANTTLYADCLLDSGRLEMFWGHPAASLALLEQARGICATFGAHRLEAIANMYLGRACAQFAHYQRALHHLEAAHRSFQTYADPERQAECELQLAQVWTQLGRMERVDFYLNATASYYRSTGRKDYLVAASLLSAVAAFKNDQPDKALHLLSEALHLAQELGEQLQAAVARRFSGEIYLANGQMEKAYPHLFDAVQGFEAISAPVDAATALVSLGDFYVQEANLAGAQQAWEKALHLSSNIAPNVAWRANAGLAKLAERQEDQDEALKAYRAMFANLAKVRRDFWQPDVLGAFMRQPAEVLDEAIALAARSAATGDALHFIEESKAQTLAAQFIEKRPALTPTSSLDELAAEIHWLQDQIQRSGDGPGGRLRNEEQSKWVQQLIQKNRQYDEWISRLERQSNPSANAYDAKTAFSPAVFRSLALQQLGENWAAVDYYLTPKSLVGIALTPTDIQVWQTPLNGRMRLALRVCAYATQTGELPSSNDLAILGSILFPSQLQLHLKDDTILLIAPHRDLNKIPWAALRLQPKAPPLVTTCTPVIVPSLSNLALLWSREQAAPSPRQNGLIVAISDFGGRHPALPDARQEADALQAGLNAESRLLLDGEARWEQLLALVQEQKLDRFSFLHIASHAFHDPLTGRLSGVALADSDLWLDRFLELAPLPGLVTLSACSGMQSLLHEGDEPIGLATTCLAAGAQQVVASLWPVIDDRAAALMVKFYAHWWAGLPAAHALALAQREAVRDLGDDLEGWGSFLYFGAPEV